VNAPGVPIGNPGGAIAIPGAATPSTAPPSRPPLDLSLPPATSRNFPYRPPTKLPQGSLADEANKRLNPKPRDTLAEGVESAGDIDCLKDANAQKADNKWGQANTTGLLNIGPLLKRAIEDKCRK
jgi:hypothetical protein